MCLKSMSSLQQELPSELTSGMMMNDDDSLEDGIPSSGHPNNMTESRSAVNPKNLTLCGLLCLQMWAIVFANVGH
jgi:hypothetical protein